MTIRAILWDFGNTLADERWMQAPMADVPSWPDCYREFSMGGGLVDRWNVGDVSWRDVAAMLATRLGADMARVRAHMEHCCRSVSFYPLVRELSARCKLPQAIVTINPDVFSLFVVPTYALEDRYDPIVASWQIKSLDKADLCDMALAGWNGRLSRAESLLVDNNEECIDAWRERGGSAYHFRGERMLHEDFAELVR